MVQKLLKKHKNAKNAKKRKRPFLNKISKKEKWKYLRFCVITFEPSLYKTCQAPQNDRQNLSFVEDKHTYGKKMARKGHTKVIYKGTFISKQSLPRIIYYPENIITVFRVM